MKKSHSLLSLMRISLFFSLLLSCEDSEEKKLSRLVQEWEGKEIFFPEECSFSDINGNPCEAPALDAPFKIVYYVDSLGCMSCKLKLEEWKAFIQEMDSISEGRVSPFFYFHPKRTDLKELGFIIKSRDFSYPFCVDTLDLFNTKNQFPENDSFHAFLLYESNRVAVIGNPVLNPSIKDLYLQVITSEEKEEVQMELTQVSLSESELELGNLELGKTVTRNVTIKNTGSKPLIIKDVITSCDCVKAKVSAGSLRPEESAELMIEFTPDVTGECLREVYVFCNTEESPVSIQIHGKINY